MRLSKRYIREQLYNVKIVGIRCFLNDKYLLARSRKQHKLRGSSVQILGDPNPCMRMLYVHSGWAIYNVGVQWFSSIPGLQCTFVEVGEFLQHPELEMECDIVFFGYSYLFELSKGLNLSKPIWVAVHDPNELYPEVPHWKSLPPYPGVIALLKQVALVITASNEVETHLARAGIQSCVIPTCSMLAPRSVEEIKNQPGSLRVITAGRIYKRKNYELFKEIEKIVKRRSGRTFSFSARWNYTPLPEVEYMKRLDACEIYLVTSYQEGGPIPAMDAMLRGALVLSTPVGQMPELIQGGYNGYICRNLDEFVQRLEELKNDPSLLLTMRRNASQYIQVARSRKVIVAAVQRALAA